MKIKVMAAATLGNALEFFDFTLYGFFVAIISPKFFPSSDPLTSVISGFGIFAVGFLTRPIGALYFGYIGDKYGRKKALSLSILLMALPTFCMGILPYYDRIGIFASFALLLCRLLQGFSAGGEYNGAALFLVENTTHKKGFHSSILTSSGSIGALIATGAGVFFTSKGMPEWAWRAPFILGSFVAIIGYIIRNKLKDSKDFINSTEKVSHIQTVLEVFKYHKFSLMICSFIGATATIPYYMVLGFLNAYLLTKGIINPQQMMILNSIMLMVCILSLPAMGYLSDFIGHIRMMKICTLALIGLAYPAFVVFTSSNMALIIIFQVLMLVLNEGFVAPSNAIMSTLFPVKKRYTGMSFGYCLGLALFGGMTPYISGLIVKSFNNESLPFVCIIFGAALGFVAALLIERKSFNYGQSSSR